MTDRAETILSIVEENPGIHFREIMRKTGLMNGVVSHYLSKLENGNKIVAMRSSRTARFYAASISEDDYMVIKALRRPTPRILLLTLLHDDGLSFVQLVDKADRSPSTVSLYLARLVKDELETIRISKLKKYYYLSDREKIDRLLDHHGPSLLDKYASNLEDMINPIRF